MIEIAPSIIAFDLLSLKEELDKLTKSGANAIHLDVMDGNFVPNITLGPALCKSIKDYVKIPCDVHLMITAPERSIDDYISFAPRSISFHLESTKFSIPILQKIEQKKIKAGIAINPDTPLSLLQPIIEHVDFVLVMCVSPGFYGQKFMAASVERVKEVRSLGQNFYIAVDGGIDDTNAKKLKDAGASYFVSGKFVSKSKDYRQPIETLKSI